ncbi:hypothetical protein [Dactylosporangium sp. NPDC049140]|uniref:hypothetical protein n=1 Tax=Dactylosporangium sp. NPDC049140 TaxID=3155647 RepID=UPI00340F19C1
MTLQTFRKTVTTLLDREASTKAASQQLGHSHETVTEEHCIVKAKQAPDVSRALQTLTG